jgi:hypothetical protein
VGQDWFGWGIEFL